MERGQDLGMDNEARICVWNEASSNGISRNNPRKPHPLKMV